MPISSGTRLGPYEIVAPIGAGGMGEVYRARDTRLDRSVAVKILPPEFASDVRLKLRFEREAKTISHLSHPNICTLFDVGDNYIVMELLEGESLADRLTRGPLPLTEALKVGVQIAEALGKAHREGVVHRDLKPGNIMLTKSGAKLLDFGLAKTATARAGVTDATVQKPLTQEGYVLGTFQYMAPEQVGGEEPDPRSDIFALGAVLYEMATGKRAFEGKTKTSLIAAIVSGEPVPMSTLQPLTPPAFEHVVKKCLAKERDDRWQSASDIAEELRWISESGSQAGVATPLTVRRKIRELFRIGITAALAIALGIVGVLYSRAKSAKPPTMQFSIPLAANTNVFRFENLGFAISPDGTRIAFVLRDASVGRQIYVRPLATSVMTVLPETRGASLPFWSPDGDFIAFFAGGKLKKVPASGGSPQTICDAPVGRGGTWNRNGEILFTPTPYSGLFVVSASGGTPRPVTRFDRAKEVCHRWAQFLPDGRQFIFQNPLKGEAGHGRIFTASLEHPEARLVLDNASNGVYVEPGWLIFSRGNTLMAVRFDASKTRVTGEPVTLPFGKVGYYEDRDQAHFTASNDGTIVTLPPWRPLTQLQWLDRTGKAIASEDQPAYFISASISPDGKRIAVTRADPADMNRSDVWVHDVGTASTSRITYDGYYRFVRWSADGRSLFYTSLRTGNADIQMRPVMGNAAGQPVVTTPYWKERFDVSPDGKYLVADEQYPETEEDLVIIALADHKSSLYVRTPRGDVQPAFSPDGNWIAYSSAQSGTSQVYVRHFPDMGEQWQVSADGGLFPKWSRDGRELFFDSFDGDLMAATVHAGESFRSDSPRALFHFDPLVIPEGVASPVPAVSTDGKRFLTLTKAEGNVPPAFNVVLNWQQSISK